MPDRCTRKQKDTEARHLYSHFSFIITYFAGRISNTDFTQDIRFTAAISCMFYATFCNSLLQPRCKKQCLIFAIWPLARNYSWHQFSKQSRPFARYRLSTWHIIVKNRIQVQYVCCNTSLMSLRLQINKTVFPNKWINEASLALTISASITKTRRGNLQSRYRGVR